VRPKLLCAAFAMAVGLVVVVTPAAHSWPPGTINVPSTLETTPTGVKGDTADDAAIWVNTADPAASLVITNEKKAGHLTVFNLAGQVVQKLTGKQVFFGNVDVRGDIVAAANSGIMVYRVTPTANGPRLVAAREASGNVEATGEGLCMYDPGEAGVSGGLYVVNVYRPTNRVRMFPLTDKDNDGLLQVEKPVRDFNLGSEGEGCEIDDATGTLYLSEEDVGIWRVDLNVPGLVPPRTSFATIGPTLSPDIEGLALAGGVLYASAQNVAAPKANWVSRFDAATGDFLGSFRISDSTGSDDCDQTDGIDAYDGYLNPTFPEGLFVCQDGYNDKPGTSGTQDFKYAPLQLLDGVP
jgi:myo-inositol-hexaphosphate 3-phosphohydrolase